MDFVKVVGVWVVGFGWGLLSFVFCYLGGKRLARYRGKLSDVFDMFDESSHQEPYGIDPMYLICGSIHSLHLSRHQLEQE